MYNTNFFSPAFALHIHFYLGMIFVLGLVLFGVWAVKSLDKKDLLSWVIALLLIGGLGALFTSNWGLYAGLMKWDEGMMQQMQKMMDESK